MLGLLAVVGCFGGIETSPVGEIPPPPPPPSISVSMGPEDATIAVGQSVEFTAMAVNFAEPSWAWSSMDQLTATISPSGTLTGRRPGLAVVAACAPSPPRYCGTASVQVQ